MMIGPITPIQVLLSLQVLYAFYASPQSIDNVATSEVCRFVDAESLQMQEVENDEETFREHEEYTIEWIVNIMEGPDVADEIADKYGFVNFGPVSSSDLKYYNSGSYCSTLQISSDDAEQSETLYRFVLMEQKVMLMPRYEPYLNKTQLLTTDGNVS